MTEHQNTILSSREAENNTILLIDGEYPQERRLVIMKNDVLLHYENEIAHHEETKGNIYLGKITRVEPSLNAVFVDIGQERSGFLPFSDIHPEYYNITIEEKEILLEQLRKNTDPHHQNDKNIDYDIIKQNKENTGTKTISPQEGVYKKKHYNIKEVIYPGQVILVQVTRSSRGAKGNLLTTFLSLVGRLCILQPHALKPHIGISQKIVGTQRAIFREIIQELNELFKGCSVIVRTAATHDIKKIDIKKDLDYLLRLWALIRRKASQNVAPSLIYEEGDLIIHALRDLYTKDIDKIIVSGADSYKKTQFFIKLLLPSHSKKVFLHKEAKPLFHVWPVEKKIEEMTHPCVFLPSGGSLMISLTEALISIDVNSSKSKKGRNIEEIALHTNLEAAQEIARQIILRDLSGLIVIDFIDLSQEVHKDLIYQKMMEALKEDRAKLTILPLSELGLMQLSRQRLRISVLEKKTGSCTHCRGTGVLQDLSALSLSLLRELFSRIEDKKKCIFSITASPGLILYVLNHYKQNIHHFETVSSCAVRFLMHTSDQYTLDSSLFTIEETAPEGEKNSSTPVSWEGQYHYDNAPI